MYTVSIAELAEKVNLFLFLLSGTINRFMHTLPKYEYITQEDYIAVAGPDWPNFEDFLNHDNVPDWVYKEIDEMLPRKEPFTPKSWCVNPFYSYEIPANTHCCLLPKKHDISKIRKQMLAGVRPPECSTCWNLEDQNLLSDRLIKNQSLDHWSNIDLETLYNNSVGDNTEILNYKIDTSNHCNGICVTCNSQHSSSWGLLETKNNIIASSNWAIKTQELDTLINYRTCKMLSFRGGEPLLSNTNFEILENLVNEGNTGCFISFVTNGSTRPTKRQNSILKNFKNVNFCFSIDGIQKRFEYLRFPLKWQTVNDNVTWAKHQGYSVSVSYTLSNLNVLYHNETVSWFEDNDIPYLINIVNYPRYFSPGVLPGAVKKQFKSTANKDNLHNMIDFNTDTNHTLWNEFVCEINKQDSMKNISIDDYLPELSDAIEFN